MRRLLTQGTLGDGAAQVPSEQMDVLVRSLRWEESSHSPGSREGGTGPTPSVGNRESENGDVSRQQPGPGAGRGRGLLAVGLRGGRPRHGSLLRAGRVHRPAAHSEHRQGRRWREEGRGATRLSE